MPVTTPCYCSREDAQRSIDFADGITTQVTWATDRAIQSAARNIEGELHRVFVPHDGNWWKDFPNHDYAMPWRAYRNEEAFDFLCLTALSSGGVPIPLNNVFLYPLNPRPGFPWTRIELDRSSSSTFGGNASTPQAAIQATGTFGFTAAADQVTALADAVTSASQTTVQITDSSQAGVGDLLIVGYSRGSAPFPDDPLPHAGLIRPYLGERVLVRDKAAVTTGLTQTGSGCSTAMSSDNQLNAGGTTLNVGEVLLLDAEQMLITASDGTGTYVVVRAWNGTVLADHAAATIYAYRLLTVVRGFLGTSPAPSWPAATEVWKHRVPSLIRDLAIAESANRILQETSGYARVVGAAEGSVPAPGVALADLWDEARASYGRISRMGVI